MSESNGTANGKATRARRVLRNPTASYHPQAGWFGYPLSLLDGAPFFTWLDIPRMLRDPRVRFIERMWRSPFQRVKFQVKADDPRVARYVGTTLRLFWRGSLPKILSRYFRYGFAPGGAEFCVRKGLVRLERVRAVEPRDARPLVWAKGKEYGNPAGFVLSVNGSGSPWSPQSATDGSRGGVWVAPGNAFWFAGYGEISPWYDMPPLANLFEPWAEKRARGGAVHLRRQWFRKAAGRGAVLYHPEGETDVGEGATRNNQDIARETLEYAESNSVFTFTNEMNPGNPAEHAWELKEAESRPDVAGFREYPQDLDREMLEGAGIPPEVLEAADVGSGWSGRLIPLLAFLGGVDELAGMLVEAADAGWLREAVRANFGDAHYEVTPLSLAEEIQTAAQSGKGGGEGPNPIPGLLGVRGAEPRQMSWVAFEGDRGGKGWRNEETGEVRYQEHMPADGDGDPSYGRARALVRALKGLPRRAVKAAKAKVNAAFQKLENRYGPGYAKLILRVSQAGVATPIPGAIVAAAGTNALVLAVAELHLRLRRLGAPEPENPDVEGLVKPAARWFLARLFGRRAGGIGMSDDRADRYEDEVPENPPEPKPVPEHQLRSLYRDPPEHGEEEFHARIHEAPAEGTAALAYADWLREHGLHAHADVVQQHAARTRGTVQTRRGQAGLVLPAEAAGEYTDPDVPWETAISTVHQDDNGRQYRVFLHRRSLHNPNQLIRWGSDFLPAAEAAKLVRRLVSEARPRLPEPGEYGSEIATSGNTSELLRHGLPEFVKKTLTRHSTESLPPATVPQDYWVYRWTPDLMPSGVWRWRRNNSPDRVFGTQAKILAAHPGAVPHAEMFPEGGHHLHMRELSPEELAHWKHLLREAGEPEEFHTGRPPRGESHELSAAKTPFEKQGHVGTKDFNAEPYLYPEELPHLTAGRDPEKVAEKQRDYQKMAQRAIENKSGVLPTLDEVKALADVGEPVAGTYPDMHRTVEELLGNHADANRWATINAILSANTPWEAHTAGAFHVLAEWKKAGRPTTKAGLDKLFGYRTGKVDKKTGEPEYVPGTVRGISGFFGDKRRKVRSLLATPGDPGVEWSNIVSGDALKTPNFGKAFVDENGFPLDVHMSETTIPEGYSAADIKKIAGGRAGPLAEKLTKAHEKIASDPIVSLAYKTLAAKAGEDTGRDVRTVQEMVWAGKLAIHAVKYLHDNPRESMAILKNLTRRAVQQGWSLTGLLANNPMIHAALKAYDVSPRRLARVLAAVERRLPAGPGSPSTKHQSALESVAARIPGSVPAGARPVLRALGHEMSDDRGDRYEDEEHLPLAEEFGRADEPEGALDRPFHSREHTEPEFLARMREQPHELGGGHALADWYEENGMPGHAELLHRHLGNEHTVRAAQLLTARQAWTLLHPYLPRRGAPGTPEPPVPDDWTHAISVERDPGRGGAEKPYHESRFGVRVFRRNPENPDEVFEWVTPLLPHDEAQSLTRRLHAEAEKMKPAGGRVVEANHAGPIRQTTIEEFAHGLARDGYPPGEAEKMLLRIFSHAKARVRKAVEDATEAERERVERQAHYHLTEGE